MNTKKKTRNELTQIPGVGKVVANDLVQLGYSSISDLKGKNAEDMYIRHNELRGSVQDICMLYTFRCAIYYANTMGKRQDPEKLKWWNWMEDKKISSKQKDKQIREKIKKQEK